MISLLSINMASDKIKENKQNNLVEESFVHLTFLRSGIHYHPSKSKLEVSEKICFDMVACNLKDNLMGQAA